MPSQTPTVTPNLILEVLRAGVITVDAKGVVTTCNPHGAELLRRPLGEIVGRPVAALLAPLEDLRDRAGGHDRGELTLHNGGAESVLGYTLSELPDGGGAVFLFQEISSLLTLRKERDRLLQLAAVGEVLPSILHELRNPLAAITNMLEVLVEEAPEGALQLDLHGVLAEVRRMSLGLQGIGGLGRSVQGGTCEAIDEAISEAVRVLQPTADRKGVELVDAVSTLPLLSLDRAVVKGIVFNLVRNAIDACSQGDRIRAEASLIRGIEDTFELRVIDTGKGMSKEVIERCSEIFFTTKESGSGIGLAICRQAAERAGGSLRIESEPGRGTTVTVRVPLAGRDEKGRERSH